MSIENMTGTCATCQHYSLPDRYDASSPTTGKYGYCGMAASVDGEPNHVHTLAFASDAEKYVATLRVKPEFGCVMWETTRD